MAASNYDMEVPTVTEATPLSPSLRHHPQTIHKKQRVVASILFLVVSSILALVILLRQYFTISVPIHDIHIPSERREIVEHNEPERIFTTLSVPPLYLSSGQPLLGRNKKKSFSSRRVSALRWGILGPGRIAHDFTSTLLVSGCTVTAVAASHDNEITSAHSRAKMFAERFSIPNYYGKYEELASDPNVDIVYVATTNQNHMGPTLMMLRAGKNVLVEKPTTVTYEETKIMYDEAKKRGLFLMTNHWTRFFPLITYLRRTFLASAGKHVLDESEEQIFESTTYTSNISPKIETKHIYNLGKTLAMRGDFSFPTPVNPSDRFLNRTLGGGVTLDVGCYLVELALLAAHGHHRSHKSLSKSKRKALKRYLIPDGIVATGHGMYHGLVFPVDVEASFSLRWGGGSDGILAGCGKAASAGMVFDMSEDRRCETTSTQGGEEDDFTMIGSFQASFRRPSTFEVEYIFENGRALIHRPGNGPSEMTIYEHKAPFGPLIRETKISFPLPPIKDKLLQYGRPNYPRAEGFVYVIDAIEKCMAERGVPGKTEDLPVGSGCLELEENTIEEQLVTVGKTSSIYFFANGNSNP